MNVVESKLCCVCQNRLRHAFNTVVLNKYRASASFCMKCGLLQIDNPTWLNEAYIGPIASSDTGLVERNLCFSRMLTPLLFHVFGSEKRFVDFAGGTGLFTRLMRDAGFDFYWNDPYCTNVHAKGFEFVDDKAPYAAVTAIELFEHVINPIEFVKDTISKTKTGVIIFSTILFDGLPPKTEEWSYYSFETGQHITFYQKKTLRFIADTVGLNYRSFDGLHFFFDNKQADSFASYIASRLTRRIARYKANRNLQSKTLSDSTFMLKKSYVN